jgi:hypothetical protein
LSSKGVALITKRSALAVVLSLSFVAFGSTPADVHLESTDSVGPRQLEEATKASLIRDYLQAWQNFDDAMANNRAAGLEDSFVGWAKEKLATTIRAQQDLGITAQYQDRSHDVQVLFYSPEGLSIELQDTVDYDVQVSDHGRTLPVQHVHSRYMAVLTPTEVRWKVRVFEGAPLK